MKNGPESGIAGTIPAATCNDHLHYDEFKLVLQRNFQNHDNQPPSWWEELGHGAPTIAGFARLCSEAMLRPDTRMNDQLLFELAEDSRAILQLGGARGSFEIRSNRDGFDSAERFLAVCVEVELDRWRLLLDKQRPEQTIRFLEGFRQLCQAGLVLHHVQREFSLSARGYEVARLVQETGLESLLGFGTELEI